MTILQMMLILLVLHRALRVSPTPLLSPASAHYVSR